MRRAACAAVLAAGLAAAPVVLPTAAAWQDDAFARGALTVAPADCSATGLFESAAAAAHLAGGVQGAAVGGTAAFAPVSTGTQVAASASSRALSVDAVGTVPSAGGVVLPVQLTPHASWTQRATTSATGAATATTGGGAAFGSVDVSGLLARPPSASGQLPGLTGVALDVGRVDATAALDGCAAGFGGTGALTRSSTVSALALRLTDDVTASALAAITAKGADTATALAGAGTAAAPRIAAAASDALLAAVQQALAALQVVGSSAVAVPAPVTVAVNPAGIAATGIGAPTTGAVTMDLATGGLALDLAPVAGPDADVLTPAVVARAAASVSLALSGRAAALRDAAGAARDGAVVAVHPSIDVGLTLAGVTTRVATVDLQVRATAAEWAAGTVPGPAATLTVLSGAPIAGLADAVSSRIGAALTSRMRVVQTAFIDPATTEIAASTAAVTGLATAAGTAATAHLGALPSVVTVTADLRATVPADSWTGAVPAGVGLLTALRIRVRDASATRADLFIGDAAVGPARAAFR